MPPLEVLALVVVVAATLALFAVMLVVITGIRREERELTMTRKKAPGPAAWLTRQIVDLYIRKTDPEAFPGTDRPVRQECKH
jgi:hypothetical protein